MGLPALSEGQDEAELPTEKEEEEAPAELEVAAEPLAATAARSPGPDESYDEYDWEEEDQSVS